MFYFSSACQDGQREFGHKGQSHSLPPARQLDMSVRGVFHQVNGRGLLRLELCRVWHKLDPKKCGVHCRQKTESNKKLILLRQHSSLFPMFFFFCVCESGDSSCPFTMSVHPTLHPYVCLPQPKTCLCSYTPKLHLQTTSRCIILRIANCLREMIVILLHSIPQVLNVKLRWWRMWCGSEPQPTTQPASLVQASYPKPHCTAITRVSTHNLNVYSLPISAGDC